MQLYAPKPACDYDSQQVTTDSDGLERQMIRASGKLTLCVSAAVCPYQQSLMTVSADWCASVCLTTQLQARLCPNCTD